MKKTTLFIALVAASLTAMAATLTATWTNPTQNTDGTAIPATGPGSIASTTVEYGPCNAAQTALASVTGTFSGTGSATTATSPNLAPGTWCAQARTVNTYGEVSAPSNVGVKTIAAPKPNAPTNFSWN